MTMRRSTNRGRLGDYKVVDDRTGFTRWRSECIKEWNGLLVHRSVYEARHPLDFLRGVRDDSTIRDGRPEPAIADLPSSGPNQTTIARAGIAGDYSINVSSTSGFAVGDWIRVFLDSGDTLITQVQSVEVRIDNPNVEMDSISLLVDDANSLAISSPLPGAVSVGNLVIDMTN